MQIVAFGLDGYRYAVPLDQVRELARVPTCVPLPKAPAIIEGIFNLRGKAVPVLDIRARFRLPPKSPHPADHLIIAMAGTRLTALRVDRVHGQFDIDDKDIEVAAAVTPRTEYLAGIAKLPDGLVLIHDLTSFLADAEALALDDALAMNAPTSS